MKNVAKYDTWCELQNPVNHRVFECKLRPKPMAEGTFAWASRIAQRHGAAAATGGEQGLGRANNPLWKPALIWTRQAGLPAEFKHINKRRKRNLQGFP
ncbi:hypothetical protein RND81_05G004800 [Saponaria officinalis]|uniref:Uncharacterized protein n=1 Tax=Saponaria officinalis TaxID=3572 RepID=A0AAW1KW23_SAPOF